jgi:hypothetical protein
LRKQWGPGKIDLPAAATVRQDFIVLNSDLGNAAASNAAKQTFWSEQTRWLEEDLARSQKADFRFVMALHKRLRGENEVTGRSPLRHSSSRVKRTFSAVRWWTRQAKRARETPCRVVGGSAIGNIFINCPGVMDSR